MKINACYDIIKNKMLHENEYITCNLLLNEVQH